MASPKKRTGFKAASAGRYSVFLSHSSKDRWVARQMARLIEEAGRAQGIRTFLDEKDIRGGDSISQTIRANLRACSELVVLLTRNSVKREWVLVEIAGAWVLGKRVVAITDQVLPKELPDVIANCLAIDLNDFDTYLTDVLYRAKELKTP